MLKKTDDLVQDGVPKQMVLMTMPKVQMTKSKGLKGFQLEVWVRAEGL